MSLDLFEHQICDPLAGCIVHLFLCTQNTFNLPRCLDIQAFFSNLQHSANPKDMEPSIPLFISISSLSTKLPVHESIPISNALEILVLKSTTCISHHLKQLVQTCYLHTMCKCMYLTFRTYIITVIHGELNKVFFQALNFNHSIMNTRVMSPVLQTCAYSCVMCNIEEIIVCNLLWQTLHRFNYYFTRIGSHCMQSLCMVFSRIMRIKGPFYEMCHEYILMSTYPSM